MDINQEKTLERKYQGVLTYVDSKQFLAKTPYTSAKISGAIKRFCRTQNTEKPTTFVEMEPFVNDLADFWIDTNPELHINGERLLYSALSNYVAFAIVWKAKAKTSNIISQDLMNQVGKMLILKNTLVAAVKLVNSRIAHDKCPNLGLYNDFKTVLPEAFYTLLPVVNGIQKGTLTIPEGQTENDLIRLIGCFFANEPTAIGASQKLKQIKHRRELFTKAAAQFPPQIEE